MHGDNAGHLVVVVVVAAVVVLEVVDVDVDVATTGGRVLPSFHTQTQVVRQPLPSVLHSLWR